MYKWKIWYDDNTMFSSEDGNAIDAPVDGIQAILQWLPFENYVVVPSSDYYWWLGDRWAGGDSSGLERYLRKRDPNPVIIYGRWAASKLFQRIQMEVHGEIEHVDVPQREE